MQTAHQETANLHISRLLRPGSQASPEQYFEASAAPDIEEYPGLEQPDLWDMLGSLLLTPSL